MRALAGAAATWALFALAARVEWPSCLLALVALAPWLYGLDGARPRAALGSAALLAAALTATTFSWLPPTLAAYAGAPAWAAWLVALAAAPLVLQPQLLAAAAARLLAARLEAPRGLRGAATALAYVGAEWALPRLFPDSLGIALHPAAPLRQLADLAGVPGLTLLCLGVSEALAAAAAGRRLRPLALAALAVALATGYGAARLRQVEEATRAADTFEAGVVQAAITAYDKLAAEQGTYEAVRQILDAHLALSEALLAAGPLDLLVWPETVYPTTFGAPKSEAGAEFDAELAALSARTATPLVFGAFAQDAAGEHNAAFLLQPSPRGVSAQHYAKSLLFPLTERVPSWLDGPTLRRALPWAGRWTPGPGPRALSLGLRGGPISFAPLICYEAIHPAYVARAAAQGTGALLTLSNDAWFPDARAPRLHLLAASFRSVETRLPMLRATNSGISALVLPSGEIVAPTRFGERTVLRLRVPRAPGLNPLALRWGDWLGPAALLSLAILGALRWLRAGRQVDGNYKSKNKSLPGGGE